MQQQPNTLEAATPHFPLPSGYDSADHYLTDLVLKGANERYKDTFVPEVTTRIKQELHLIRKHQFANELLIAWDYIREAHSHGFCTAPGGNRTPGSIVCYCLGITDIDPISANLTYQGLLCREQLPDLFVQFSSSGEKYVREYLNNKYGNRAANIRFREYFVIDIVEQTIASVGQGIDFRTLPYDTPELLQFFMQDADWLQYSYFGRNDMEELKAIAHPTFEDMVRIFATRNYSDGSQLTTPREHAYAHCVLFLRTAWLKMHFPTQFHQSVTNILG